MSTDAKIFITIYLISLYGSFEIWFSFLQKEDISIKRLLLLTLYSLVPFFNTILMLGGLLCIAAPYLEASKKKFTAVNRILNKRVLASLEIGEPSRTLTYRVFRRIKKYFKGSK